MFGRINRLVRKIKKKKDIDVFPDEVFLDSTNLPDFDTNHFEGRIEKPISFYSFSIFYVACFLLFIIFISRAGFLQILEGESFKNKSENNKLKEALVVAPRGVIYDRYGVPLVWNEPNDEYPFPLRKYIDKPGFANLLGFVKYPAKDKSGFYYQEDFIPKDGLELYLNEVLVGNNGKELFETDATGKVLSQNVIVPSKSGENLVSSIDSRIQKEMYKAISEVAEHSSFQGGAGIMMDINSGEILSLVSYPDYDSNIMSEGKDIDKIKKFLNDPSNPFLDRAIAGLYTPGSIIKPFLAFGALEENIISPEKIIVSTGKMTVPNPYNPDAPTIFKDWKVHGAVDMRRAISVSSDVYFYYIGGGFAGQEGLGITRIDKYLKMFGFGENTGIFLDKEAKGVIPSPEWKAKTFLGDDWRLGDTYNTSIGQYGMLVTPLQAVRATASIANNGYLVDPSFVFTATSSPQKGNLINSDKDLRTKNFDVVRDGMRDAVVGGGTAGALNVPYVSIAGKTGTAEVGAKKQYVHSWIVGFFPYEKPHYAFVILMEKAPEGPPRGAPAAMRQVLDNMHIKTPEYFE